jgi:hypothetical protein
MAGLLAGPSRAGERSPLFRYETEHYSVETDTNEKFAEAVGRHMEAIYGEYASRFHDYGKVAVHFNVAVYNTEAGYWNRVPVEVRGSTGVFISAQRLLAAHCDGRTGEEVLRTLYHEGFHQFMYLVISQQCPIWLNEGLAEYFSEATWNGGGFTTGLVPTMRLFVVQQALRDGTYIHLSDLFSLKPEQWLQNVRTDKRRASLHYAEAWSVAQFLIRADGGRYAPLLDKFLQSIHSGRDEREAFSESFGSDVTAFEQVWAAYVMSLEPSPEFRCRDNLEAILLLAQMVYGDPRKFSSIENLRWELLFRPRYSWQITRPNGEKITSDMRSEVAALFRCPFDRSGGISYIVITNLDTGLPVVVCSHHAGVIIKAYYNPSGNGLQPVVEEQARELVSPDMWGAIEEATARSGARGR